MTTNDTGSTFTIISDGNISITENSAKHNLDTPKAACSGDFSQGRPLGLCDSIQLVTAGYI